jgi:hypothetical protein
VFVFVLFFLPKLIVVNVVSSFFSIIEIFTQALSGGAVIKNNVENEFYNNCIFKLYDFKILEDIK